MENEKPTLESLAKALQVKPYLFLLTTDDASRYGSLRAHRPYLVEGVYPILDIRPSSLKSENGDFFVKLVDVEFNVISDKGYERVSYRAFCGFE